MVRRLAAWVMVGLAALSGVAMAAEEPQLTPLVGAVLAPPHQVPGSDGRRHLVYELEIANATQLPVHVSSVEVVDPATGKAIFTLDQAAVAGRLSIGGRRGLESADLGVGQYGVLFVHMPLDAGSPVPAALVHRVAAVIAAQEPVAMTMTMGETAVVTADPVVLGPPLAGRSYIAGDGCCDSIRHVRALLALDGRFALAQRFAIDWEQADWRGQLIEGDPKKVADYLIYGKDVLAVADGTVVAMRNDLKDQPPGELPPGLPLDEADGNFVVLDIGGGAFVLFAHMQENSVTVAAGDTVKRGQILGKVGNTGNTQAPHLHLHVMNGPSALASNGLPYVIDSYEVTAVDRAGTADFDRAEATGSPLTLTKVDPPRTERGTLPLDLYVVDF